jgi:hypothetical protein
LFYHIFGRFSMRGGQKHDKKNIEKNKSDPSPFSYSDPPTHHGGPPYLFFAGPIGLGLPCCLLFVSCLVLLESRKARVTSHSPALRVRGLRCAAARPLRGMCVCVCVTRLCAVCSRP